MIKKIIDFIWNIFGIKGEEKENKQKEATSWYTKKEIMTDTEKRFYKMFKSILEDECILWPQINLATIIKKNGQYKWQTELYRNIDFAIFSKENFELLLLIEINDETHNLSSKTKRRDKSVRELCEEAGFSVMSFWLNKPNEYYWVKNRILEHLNSLKQKKENDLNSVSEKQAAI